MLEPELPPEPESLLPEPHPAPPSTITARANTIQDARREPTVTSKVARILRENGGGKTRARFRHHGGRVTLGETPKPPAQPVTPARPAGEAALPRELLGHLGAQLLGAARGRLDGVDE